MEITVHTRPEDILGTHGGMAKMLRLATITFNRTGGAAFRAFTQFGLEDLAKLIEAKQDGLFNYGALIVDGENFGVSYPNNTAAVMSLLGSPYPKDMDLIAVGALTSSGEEVIQMIDIFPKLHETLVGGPAVTESPTEVNEEVPTCSECDCSSTKVKARGMCSKHYRLTRKAEKEAADAKTAEEAVGDLPNDGEPGGEPGGQRIQIVGGRDDYLDLPSLIESAALKAAEALRAGMSEDMHRIVEDVQGEGLRIETLLHNLVARQHALDNNLRRALVDFVGPDFVWEGADLATAMGVSEDSVQSCPPVTKDHQSHSPTGEECPPCVVEDSPMVTSGGEAVGPWQVRLGDGSVVLRVLNSEDVEGMGLRDLREYGKCLGIEPSRFSKDLVRRIKEKLVKVDAKQVAE